MQQLAWNGRLLAYRLTWMQALCLFELQEVCVLQNWKQAERKKCVIRAEWFPQAFSRASFNTYHTHAHTFLDLCSIFLSVPVFFFFYYYSLPPFFLSPRSRSPFPFLSLLPLTFLFQSRSGLLARLSHASVAAVKNQSFLENFSMVHRPFGSSSPSSSSSSSSSSFSSSQWPSSDQWISHWASAVDLHRVTWLCPHGDRISSESNRSLQENLANSTNWKLALGDPKTALVSSPFCSC